MKRWGWKDVWKGDGRRVDGPEDATRNREHTHFVIMRETDTAHLLHSCTEDKNT